MELRKLTTLIFGLFILFPLVAQADTLVRPRIGLGLTSYSLDNSLSGDTIAESDFTTLQIGLTFAIDNFYIDLSSSSSLDATYTFTGSTQENDFERTDTAFVVGFAFDGFSLFGGLKNGVTTLTVPFGSVTAVEFEASGPFFGISGSSGSESGVLSYNVALAILTATFSDNDSVGIPQNAESDASVGFSAGIGYTKFLSDSTSLSFKGQYQLYSYTDFVDPNYTDFNDFDESLLSFDATFVVNF